MQVEQVRRQLVSDYSRYEIVKQFLLQHESEIEEEQFGAEVGFLFSLPVDRVPAFDEQLKELSHGQLAATTLEDELRQEQAH
jgi:putative IMPACT (imprinted ancient) family translation regulator